jgi:hypothetical protein
MNYNASETSEFNNIDFLANSQTNDENVSNTSPFMQTEQNQTGGFWPFSSSNDNKLLYIALLEKNANAAIFLAKHAKNIGEKKDGKTILHYILHNYNSMPEAHNIIATILSRNDVRNYINKREDVSGDTALHIAARNGNNHICAMLIKAGADPKIRNSNGLYIISESEPDNILSPSRTIHYSDSDNVHTDEEAVRNLLNGFLNLERKNNYSDTMVSMPSHLSINSNTTMMNDDETLVGGSSDETEMSELLNTEQFVDKLLLKYNTMTNSEQSYQQGGNRKSIMGVRKMTTLSEYTLSGGLSEEDDNSTETELSRLIKRQSDEIHERTVKKIMDLMNVDEKTARNYKAAIYRKVKESHPELNNLDRAVEMEKLATKAELKKIDIKKITKEIEEHIAKKQSENSSETPKAAKQSKEKKPSKGKKALSNTSPASVPSESGLSITSNSYF